MQTDLLRTVFCLTLLATFSPNLRATDTLLPAAAAKKYYLAFSARPARLQPFSVGGHAFVTWGIGSGGNDSVAALHTYGFFPNERSNVAISLVTHRPGQLVRGFFKNSSRQKIRRMVVCVDSATWQSSLDSALAWDRRGYNLFDRNCVTFMDAMADVAGLDTPRKNSALGIPRKPVRYIKGLFKKNQPREVAGVRVFDVEDRVCENDFVEGIGRR